ncbi:MAG: sialidase, partial [Acidobacteria bacterium]|nr:sialidase [Acidobacteriota bacterium]
PGDTNTYYAGAASGGVWKTTDGGRTFTPVFDDQPVQAIGTLALAPSDPNTIWAGTGEAWVIRPSDVMGDGIYKSTDAGKTWKNMGLPESGRIGRIVVHPTDPNIVFACVLGRATGPQQERGVYRTKDGGATWERVLFVNPDTGCSGLSMNAKDPNVLVAGTWQVVMHTWAMFSGGPGGGVYISRDGGTKWSKAESAGLPRPPVGKIDVAVAPTNSNRVYALIQTANQGSLWRSDDAGANWKVVSWDRTLVGRAGYYIRLGVSPKDENEVFVMSSSPHRSTDGGLTFTAGGGGCGDCHDIWIDPTNPDHYVTTGDGGMGITTTHGKAFTSVVLPIGQMYHVATDNRVPYWIYSNRQDDGTMRGASDSPVQVANVPSYGRGAGVGGGRGGGPSTGSGQAGRGGRGEEPGGRGAPGEQGRGRGEGGGRGAEDLAVFFGGGRGGGTPWDENVGGCESGFTIPDLADPNIVWASCYGNKLTRYDARTKTARSVSPWIITLDSPPTDSKYRCHWTAPIAIDPFDHTAVYYGCQVIFRTQNGGQSWDVVSPDLSTQDKSRIVSSGGVVGDNLGQFSGELVFAIAPSPVQKGLIWAGTNDGKIWYTKDAAKTWTDVTKNVTGMPAWGTISKIEPSNFDPATAYVAVDYHIMDNRDPFIYKTTDFGQTWRKISDGLPRSHPLAYVQSVAENPNQRGMLFAGTGNGFFYSMNDGGTWTLFQTGLPRAPVTWVVVQKQHHDVVVSTYGRGLYILRDITPLEQSGPFDGAQGGQPTTTETRVFAPRPGFRLPRSGSALINYALTSAPSGPIEMEILDAAGQVIRRQQVTARAGLNRATWDLRYDPPRRLEFRTTPPENPQIWDEPRFRNAQTRPLVHWGINATTATPIAAPGNYSVRFTIDGQPLTQPFEVVKDSNIQSSDADLVESTKMQVRIRDDINQAADMINRIEVVRRQIEDLLKANRGKDEIEKPLRDMDRKMLDVELRLLTRSDMMSDDKFFVEAYRVYMNLVWLGGAVGLGAGDEAGGAEYRPREASYQILEQIEKELAVAKAGFTTLTDQEIPAFNKSMSARGLSIGQP